MPEISSPHKTSHQNGGEDEISVAGLSGELADAQPPKAHATSHEDGKADPIDASKLDKMLKIIPYNGKIADITHPDTDKHTLDLATALGETRKIIFVILSRDRISGSGDLHVYPNEGTYLVLLKPSTIRTDVIVIKNGTQRLQYAQTVANDDFDLFCYGYGVET